MIRREGKKWVLYSKDGSRVLGREDSKEAIKRRERQVQYFKAHKALTSAVREVDRVQKSIVGVLGRRAISGVPKSVVEQKIANLSVKMARKMHTKGKIPYNKVLPAARKIQEKLERIFSASKRIGTSAAKAAMLGIASKVGYELGEAKKDKNNASANRR